MDKSPSITNLAKALIVFHVKVDKVRKDASNPFFKSKYASLSNILEVINEPLNESGLTFSQFPTGENGLTTILMHAESGEFIQSDYIMKPVKDDPQGKGSVITYQRRYALAAVLGLNIDEDDDANHASGLNGNTKQETAPQLPWLNKDTKEHKGAIAKLTAGTTTLSAIKAVFKLSKDMEKELSAIKPISKPAVQNQN